MYFLMFLQGDLMILRCSTILLDARQSIYGHTMYRNAFQWDAYRPLVDRIPACTVQEGCLPRGECLPGGGCLPRGRCLPRRGVSAQEEGCLPGGGGYPSMQLGRPPCVQTDTCELRLRAVKMYGVSKNPYPGKNRSSCMDASITQVLNRLCIHVFTFFYLPG